jgi:hypothetical protein
MFMVAGVRLLVPIVVVLVVIIGVLGYMYYSGGLPLEKEPEKKPWYFKGAYANYTISGAVSSYPVKGEGQIVILDYNSTHIKIKRVVKIESPVSDFNISVEWEPLDSPSPLTSDKNCTKINETNTTYAGVKVKQISYMCFKNDEVENKTYIIDPKTNIPIRVVIETDEMKIWMYLSATNIPELQVYIGKGS